MQQPNGSNETSPRGGDDDGRHTQSKQDHWLGCGCVVVVLSPTSIHIPHPFIQSIQYGTVRYLRWHGSIDSLVDQRVVYIHNMTYLSTSGGGRARLIYFFEFIYVFVLYTSLGRQSKLHSEKKYSALCRRPRRNDPFYYAT